MNYEFNNKLCVAIIIKCKDKYLFIHQEKEGGIFPNSLHTVGGKIEPNETPEQAIKRETFEEVGITLNEVIPFDFDSEVTLYKGEMTQIIALRFTAEVDNFYAKAGSDAKEFLWLSKEEILKYDPNPLTKRFVSKLGLTDKD